MKLHASKIKLAEFDSRTFIVRPAPGTTFEQVIAPIYWSHIAEQLRPGNFIKVLPDDGAYFAELLVRSVDRLSAIVAVLRKVDLVHVDALTEDPEFELKFRGPRKWSVLRRSDSKVLFEDIETREMADKALGDYVKAQAA
jgi:hypothetical protein